MDHGLHWGAVLPDFDKWLRNLVAQFTELGQPWPSARRIVVGSNGTAHEESLLGLHYPEEPLRYMMLLRVSDEGERELTSLYPMLYSGGHNTAIYQGLEIEEPWSGWELITVGDGKLLKVFNPLLPFRDGDYEPGDAYGYSLAGLAYTLRPVTQERLEMNEETLALLAEASGSEEVPQIPEGEQVEITLRGRSFLVGAGEGQDNYGVRATVEEINWLESEGVTFGQMMVRIPMPGEHWPDLAVMIYASESVLGTFRPSVGDEVEGLLWLQGIRTDSLL
uniref:Uncharacterized protein n=1 Tax=Magnetococcus massalia (strain MO-1) TaxID=451514 RepID=A0A1S7LFR8_MAGMO|nr:conserved protein of unknown function [Candidatus Magnetococcus massalia]